MEIAMEALKNNQVIVYITNLNSGYKWWFILNVNDLAECLRITNDDEMVKCLIRKMKY